MTPDLRLAATQACDVTDGCITCGDVAVALTVLDVVGADARCRDELGREETVATELVGTVQAGDRVLVHAGVAIERLAAAATGG
ncbi:MAG: hydrogenase expression/formation protein HypC [Frankiaceae bacterium]|jgi:hydrogenase maturation factor|nr:hydrogenase expression/formation protein HypC [Frankiaceae bacterium]MDQ1724713.1 hydrogenase expression/formation protein HypC [Frankiaceae bacterium]